jgi:hypothetical protein
MKVQLERKLNSCPEQLRCAVCQQGFSVGKIRTLLYSDRGLLQGDLCPACLKLKPGGIKQKIRAQSRRLLYDATSSGERSATSQQLALDLLACADEAIRLPNPFDWMLKHLEIAAQESQELEAARLGLSNCPCGKRWGDSDQRKSHFRIVFQDGSELE